MSGNGNGGGGNGGNGGGGTYGGTPIVPTNLIPASTTVLQPGSRYFRLVDAFAQLDQTLAVDTLNNDITTLQATVAALQGQVNTLQINVTALQGQMTTVQGQITTLQGQVQTLQLFMNSFNYLQLEVSTGTIFLDQRTIYRRSFVINGALNTAINVFTYPHGIAAINYIVSIQAMAGAATALQYPITFLNMATAPTLSTGLSIWADATNIYISVGTTAFSGIQVLATMWYTATNR